MRPTCTRVSSFSDSLPSPVITEHRAESPAPCSVSPSIVCFTHGISSVLTSSRSPALCPRPVTTRPFSTSVSLFLLYKQVDLHHFSRFHIEATPFTDFKSRNLSLGMINICQPLNSSSHWLLLCHPANPPGATP